MLFRSRRGPASTSHRLIIQLRGPEAEETSSENVQRTQYTLEHVNTKKERVNGESMLTDHN